ncbi:unnamed protein product, partial [Pocillopora meandrina]
MALFNILCENKATYEYQYTLALHNGNKTKACLGHTFQEIDDLKAEGMSIDGEHFDVEWYCSDWKTKSTTLIVVKVVANNDCPDVLTKEMERIQVQFKFYEEYNKLAEKKTK